jgi:hypothetical protein
MQMFYRIQIQSQACFPEDITHALGVSPSTSHKNLWIYEVNQKESDPPFDFVDKSLEILSPNYSKLEKLGISRKEISIWHLYEYNSQCNMEFSPEDMRRLGENGLTLCISCWEAD